MKAKPVYDITVAEIGKCRYTASRGGTEEASFICSDSLVNLKRGVKERGWYNAWLSTKVGCFSQGQTCVDEYCYWPKYRLLRATTTDATKIKRYKK